MEWFENILINIHGNIIKMMFIFKTLRNRIKLVWHICKPSKTENTVTVLLGTWYKCKCLLFRKIVWYIFVLYNNKCQSLLINDWHLLLLTIWIVLLIRENHHYSLHITKSLITWEFLPSHILHLLLVCFIRIYFETTKATNVCLTHRVTEI